MTLPTMVVRIAFATAPFAETPTWVDVTADVLATSPLTVQRGRQHQLDRIEAGTCTFRLNNSAGNYWPTNASGSYYPNVVPGKRVNVRATYDGTTYDLFTGFVESWQPGYTEAAGGLAYVDLTAVDLFKPLSLLSLNDGTGYASQTSDLRVAAVLDALGWPAADRDLSTGRTTLQATGAIVNLNARAHLQAVEDSEFGLLFVAGDGHVQFQDRYYRMNTAACYTSQATFGDDPGELNYRAPRFSHDDSLIYNDIRVTRSGGTEQTATDATSVTTYGKRSLVQTGLLMTTDAEAQAQAQYLLPRYKDAMLRLQSIAVLPTADEANLWPKVLGYELGTRITVRLDAAGLDKDYAIEGVRHQVQNAHWRTEWQLDDAENRTWWILETARLEVGTRLGY